MKENKGVRVRVKERDIRIRMGRKGEKVRETLVKKLK